MKTVKDLPCWRVGISKSYEKCLCGEDVDSGLMIARGVFTGKIVGCPSCTEEFSMD